MITGTGTGTRATRITGFILAAVYMSKARSGAGAGGSQYGASTSRDQGGGNKKQGLVGTTNTPSPLDARIRVRGGGANRNWIFCMNQLGGVGRRRGQASGPGNRGGVSATCHTLAWRRRQQYPPKPCGAQVRGWGAGTKFGPMCFSALTPPAASIQFSGYVYVPSDGVRITVRAAWLIPSTDPDYAAVLPTEYNTADGYGQWTIMAFVGSYGVSSCDGFPPPSAPAAPGSGAGLHQTNPSGGVSASQEGQGSLIHATDEAVDDWPSNKCKVCGPEDGDPNPVIYGWDNPNKPLYPCKDGCRAPNAELKPNVYNPLLTYWDATPKRSNCAAGNWFIDNAADWASRARLGNWNSPPKWPMGLLGGWSCPTDSDCATTLGSGPIPLGQPAVWNKSVAGYEGQGVWLQPGPAMPAHLKPDPTTGWPAASSVPAAERAKAVLTVGGNANTTPWTTPMLKYLADSADNGAFERFGGVCLDIEYMAAGYAKGDAPQGSGTRLGLCESAEYAIAFVAQLADTLTALKRANLTTYITCMAAPMYGSREVPMESGATPLLPNILPWESFDAGSAPDGSGFCDPNAGLHNAILNQALDTSDDSKPYARLLHNLDYVVPQIYSQEAENLPMWTQGANTWVKLWRGAHATRGVRVYSPFLDPNTREVYGTQLLWGLSLENKSTAGPGTTFGPWVDAAYCRGFSPAGEKNPTWTSKPCDCSKVSGRVPNAQNEWKCDCVAADSARAAWWDDRSKLGWLNDENPWLTWGKEGHIDPDAATGLFGPYSDPDTPGTRGVDPSGFVLWGVSAPQSDDIHSAAAPKCAPPCVQSFPCSVVIDKPSSNAS